VAYTFIHRNATMYITVKWKLSNGAGGKRWESHSFIDQLPLDLFLINTAALLYYDHVSELAQF